MAQNRAEDLATDMAQQVFLQVTQCLATFDQTRDFSRWIAGIAHHVTATHVLRESKYQYHVLKKVLAECQPPISESDGPDDSSLDPDRKAALLNALNELQELTRNCIMDHYGNGSTIRDLCETYGLSQREAERRLRSGMRLLRRKLGAN